MPIATYKDLCIDAIDASSMAEFWAPALGLATDPHREPPIARLVGERSGQTIWINEVPEPKTVKNRVHLDVHALALPDAIVLSTEHPWTVVADPEGGEFCVFLRDTIPAYRLYEVVVDSIDPIAQATWWGEVFGVLPDIETADCTSLENVPGTEFESMVFVRVPEAKTIKNRVHWDVTFTATGTVDLLVDRGARVLPAPESDVDWTVMADPEGNEFCVFA